MKRKWIAALLAGCMLAALLLTGCSAAETVKRLRFGVAGEGGVYHNFGEQFAALENETSNGTIELRTTAGSAANLRHSPANTCSWPLRRPTSHRTPATRPAFLQRRRISAASAR